MLCVKNVLARDADLASAEEAYGIRAAYFGWEDSTGKPLQRILKPESGPPGTPEKLYLQLGWLDGVGVYRGGTADASLKRWETENRVWQHYNSNAFHIRLGLSRSIRINRDKDACAS